MSRPEQPKKPSEDPRSLEAFARLLGGLGNPDEANSAFMDLMKSSLDVHANASGLTPEEYKYGSAESVRRASIPGYVYVTKDGKEYGPVRETWGPLDGSKEKMTALINARGDEDDKDSWVKLEYLDKDVKPFESGKKDK